MRSHSEAQALADVRARLQRRFPGLDPVVVEAAVQTAHASMVGPIREFVPVLVEHVARDRLRSCRER